MTDQDVAPAPDRAFQCEACGGVSEYAPGTYALRCPYCKHEQDITPIPRQVTEHPIEELAVLPRRASAPVRVKVYNCPGCHAVTESDTLSDKCQFCATPLVADASDSERVAPEAVLPFGVDREQARDALAKWTGSRWFAPEELKEVTEAETFRGSYLPHWTYDAQTTTRYTGERGEHYWVEEEDSEGRTRRVQHTRWHHTSGTVGRFFDDVLVPGSSQVPVEELDKLAPWPLQETVPYQEEYLAGFRTLRYDVEPEAGLESAKARMAPVIRADCRRDIGGDEQRVHSMSTFYGGVTYKLVLLPVWFLTYLHGGKTWPVMVNARTGEVIGKRPYSPVKIILASVGAALLIALVVLLVVMLRN
ncbi:hypothetical protein LK07_00345 [Streptomyces pluripotens]|uniref:Zinc ribbon domain-containing protein n=1 Tax=Streptomyces pluripotens TaxID=1355015 RepID=A0A221P764_9ACTN|nr:MULTISPECIES: hypothetical protein [unclassified Streptomyces]ASN28091.1 hypothetical protein LK07_00345 [Streptomyces pluripotens]KIE25481.1 hypothetical protein LK08_19430 [Streptomyces sp. MUSC 125]MCH0560654.1 hypothetical protein [Streptomyces sp. MUM 16J]